MMLFSPDFNDKVSFNLYIINKYVNPSWSKPFAPHNVVLWGGGGGGSVDPLLTHESFTLTTSNFIGCKVYLSRFLKW